MARNAAWFSCTARQALVRAKLQTRQPARAGGAQRHEHPGGEPALRASLRGGNPGGGRWRGPETLAEDSAELGFAKYLVKRRRGHTGQQKDKRLSPKLTLPELPGLCCRAETSLRRARTRPADPVRCARGGHARGPYSLPGLRCAVRRDKYPERCAART
jgi:hypothetical protein